MRLCRDDALMRLLNNKGYQPVVMMPRSNVQPPELYVFSNERLKRRGPLGDYLPGGFTLPDLRRGSLPEMRQKVTSSKSSKAAASFLEDALRCIGVDGAPKLDLDFARGRTLAFSFTGVTYASLDPSQVDHLLGPLDMGAVPEEQIEEGLLHLAYEYAYADTLLMQDTASADAKLDLQAVKIEQFIDLGGKAQVSVQSDTTLSFKANSGLPAAFACKIGRLERRDGTWRFFPEEIMGQGLAPNEGGSRPYLIQRGAILEVEDARGVTRGVKPAQLL